VQLKLCPKTTYALWDLHISLEDDVDGEDKSSSEEISFNDIESLEELPPQLAFDPGFTAAPNCLICEVCADRYLVSQTPVPTLCSPILMISTTM